MGTRTIFDSDTLRWAFYLDSGTDIDDTGSPVLDGYILRPSLIHVAVRCPWCQRSHLHGSGGADQVKAGGMRVADGHRAAHCTSPASPFRQDGYVVRTVGFVDQTEFEKRKAECVVCGRGKRGGGDQPFHARCESKYWSRFEMTEG